MPKRLTLLRHAKSSWDAPGLTDFDRPLNARGKKDAPAMGARLRKRGFTPDLILSSSAVRARHTTELVAAELGLAADQIRYEKDLYLASAPELGDMLPDLAEDHEDVVIVAHNPGLTSFANRIADAQIDNLPTCGVFSVLLDIDGWSEVLHRRGKLDFFDFPKNTENDGGS